MLQLYDRINIHPMYKSTSIVRVAMLLACCLPAATITNRTFAQAGSEKQTGYAPVNGLKMYYEISGTGKPLILLHGSYMSIDLNFGQIIPQLNKNHKVIALELQGHGRTADINRPYSLAAMADDVAALMKYLKIDSADVLGYSMGGAVALQLVISHPELVRKLVLISIPYKSDGWSPETRAIFPTIKPEFFEKTPLKTEYDRLAPDPKHWTDWVSKVTKFAGEPYDFGKEKLMAIKSPVLLLFGDADGVQPEHIAEMYRLVGGGLNGDLGKMPRSQLAIFPGSTHVTLMMMHTDWLLAMIPPFLN